MLELIVFVALAISSTWPLAWNFQTAIPQGQERVATVPLFNLWTIWWNVDRAGDLFSNYWDAPIFAPTDGAFALSESQPTTSIVAPIIWATESRILAYNVFLLFMLVANGCSGSVFTRGLTGSRIAGVWGGAAMVLLPFVHWQLGVIQLASLSGILLSLHFLIRFLADYHLKDALLAGVASGFCYLTCNYYGYQLCLTLTVALPVLLMKRCSVRRLAAGFVLSLVVFALLILPVVSKQLSTSGQHKWDRRPETVARLSAVQDDYFRTLWRGPLANRTTGNARFPLSPGLACSILAVIGTVIGVRRRPTRGATLFLLSIVGVAAQLSLGPGWVLGGYRPFELLADWLPGLSAMRSPYRFAVLVQVSCVALASLSFIRAERDQASQDGNTANCPTPSVATPLFPSSKWRRLVLVMHCGLLGGALIECWPSSPRMYAMPDYETQRPWIEWLITGTDADDIVANIPFPEGRSVADYEDTTRSMLWATYHKRPLANGYSGFFPSRFVELKRDVQEFPNNTSLRELRKAGVRWCVVDMSKLKSSIADNLDSQPLLAFQFETRDGMTRIYEVKQFQ